MNCMAQANILHLKISTKNSNERTDSNNKQLSYGVAKKSDILCKFQRNNQLYTTIGNRDRKKKLSHELSYIYFLRVSFEFCWCLWVKCASAFLIQESQWIVNGWIDQYNWYFLLLCIRLMYCVCVHQNNKFITIIFSENSNPSS